MPNSTSTPDTSTSDAITGVILMTYGSATTAEHVREYFENIYKGKASEELIQDFEARYRLVGGSPLIRITREQAALLEQKLRDRSGDHSGGHCAGRYIVRAGMRHSAPKIAEAIAECRAAGATRLIGIVLSPQFSSIIMEGYRTAFLSAATEQGFADDAVRVAGPWPTEPHFIDLLAQRTRDSLAELRERYDAEIPVVFTTHSLPQSVVDKDPAYLEQLTATIDAVKARLGQNGSSRSLHSYAAYQSAGHTPEAWLKPDLTDILERLAQQKPPAVPAVLIVPIQFLADHLEILYDLDVAAQEQCTERGIAYHRIMLPNADPLFIEALAALV